MKKRFPKNIQFLLADSIRQEVRNKLSVVGMYSGNQLLLQKESIPPKAPKNEKQKILVLPGLSLLITIKDGQGIFNAKFVIFDPNGKPIKKGESKIDKPLVDRAYTLILPIIPFPVVAIGDYCLELKLDSRHKYEHFFTIGIEDPKNQYTLLKKSKKPKKKRSN